MADPEAQLPVEGGSDPICDFCSEPDPKWTYPAEDFEAVPGTGAMSEGAWAACDRCHDLIEAEDREGLAKRAAERFAKKQRVSKTMAREAVRAVHRGFWAHRLGSDPDALPQLVRGWQDVLDLQVDLWRYWQSENGRRFLRGMAESFKAGDDMSTEHVLSSLALAEPISVNEDVMSIIEAAAPRFEPEALYPEDLWTPHGFVVLPRPFYIPDVNGKAMSIAAFHWSPCEAANAPPEDARSRTVGSMPDRATGSFFWFYADRDDTRDQTSREIHADAMRDPKWMHRLALTHVTPWWYGRTPPQAGDEDEASFALWQWVQAFFRVGQERIVSHTRERAQRQVRRRAERANVEPRDVLVVTLRRARTRSEDPDHHTVEWKNRWPVRGHWRWQFYPSLERHRQKWISTYIKGPEDRPLKDPLRAFEFKR